MTYAKADHWNAVFQKLKEQGTDLDWREAWVSAHLPALRAHNVYTALDLGCGTGNDVLRLAALGIQVTGMDFSIEAIEQGRAKAHVQQLSAAFVVGDMARPLPFDDHSFDAVMSNVAMHMFDNATTHALFQEVARVVRPGGIFVFHVNSTQDAALRATRRPPIRELEPNYVLEQDGQTMRFFDETYLRELLRTWEDVTLEHIEILDRDSSLPFKRVWRGVAMRPNGVPSREEV